MGGRLRPPNSRPRCTRSPPNSSLLPLLTALLRAGLSYPGLGPVPVHVPAARSPAQARAYRIADNQTATMSQWDEDRLPLELAELHEMGFDLNLTGFSQRFAVRSCQDEAATEPS